MRADDPGSDAVASARVRPNVHPRIAIVERVSVLAVHDMWLLGRRYLRRVDFNTG